MAVSTKCDSDTNREKAINIDDMSTADKGGRVGGRGNLSLVKQPLAVGGQRRISSAPP